MEILLDDEPNLDHLWAAVRVEVAGERLDRLLARLGVVPFGQFRRLAAEGRIRVHGRAVLGGAPRLPVGTRVSILDGAARPALLPERIPIRILHEDSCLMVVDKPAGLPMTPGPGHAAGTVANALRGLGRPLSGIEGPLRPGIVHRLDLGTSGALVVAKDDETHRRLARLFLAHAVERRYAALVEGQPTWAEVEVDAPLARRRAGRKAQGVVAAGKTARTRFWVRGRHATDLFLVEAVPLSGRTHQIRAHLQHLGHPIVGDTLYGGGSAAAGRAAAHGVRRMALHAVWIACPELGLAVAAPWPADLPACETTACLAPGSPPPVGKSNTGV